MGGVQASETESASALGSCLRADSRSLSGSQWLDVEVAGCSEPPHRPVWVRSGVACRALLW